MISSQQSQSSSRFQEWLSKIGLTTRILLIVNTINMFLSSQDSILCPFQVIEEHRFRQILFSAFFHMGIMHFLMNMLTLISFGPYLEKAFGSICFAGLVLLFVYAGGFLYISFEWAISGFAGTQCVIGFSGVLFALIVLETAVSRTEERSLFGIITLPAFAYPWALLFLLQMLFPVSFLGHLTGLLAGILYWLGYLQWISLPRNWILSLEAWSSIRWLTSLESFCLCPSSPPIQHYSSIGACFQYLGLYQRCHCQCPQFHQVWSNFQNRISNIFHSESNYARLPLDENEREERTDLIIEDPSRKNPSPIDKEKAEEEAETKLPSKNVSSPIANARAAAQARLLQNQKKRETSNRQTSVSDTKEEKIASNKTNTNKHDIVDIPI